jgi:hypothetical protein
LLIFLVLAILIVSFSFGNRVFAADWAVNMLNGLIESFFNAIFKLLGYLIAIVIGLARYSGFTTAAAVTSGWSIVRDVCNLFFIIILLVIAFSTILRVGGYTIKSTLPKLLMMAVLINFSKMICGLIIDAAQLIMLTFLAPLNTLSDWGFTNMFGVPDTVSFASGNVEASPFNVFASYVLGLIMILIAAVVLVVFVGVLVMRIVMLWIYVTISPLAYFLSTFPQGAGYAKKWWGDFTENVIIGPLLAFFLWLAFVSVGSSNKIEGLPDDISSPEGLTAAANFESLSRFVISIGMLIGGLMISQSMAGSTGKFAGAGLAKINAGAGWAKKKTTGAILAGGAAVAGVGLATGKVALGTVDRLAGRTSGKIINKVTGKERGVSRTFAEQGLVGAIAGGTAAVPGNISVAVRGFFEKNRELMKNAAGGSISKNGIFSHEGHKYKWNDNSKVKAYQKVDDKGMFKNDKNGDPEAGSIILKNGKKMKKINFFAAALADSMAAGTSVGRAAKNAVEDKKTSEELDKIKVSGISNDEAMRRLEAFSTAAPEKMALALFLASKKAFKNMEEENSARKVLASNAVLAEKFDDEVRKNQVHLAYDIEVKKKDGTDDLDTQANEAARMKKDLSKGKIDYNALPKDAINNKKFQSVLRDWAKDPVTGSEEKYGRIMEKNFENGGGENSKNVAEAVKNQIDTSNIEKDKSARLYASLTGKVEEAFTAGGVLNYKALGNYLAGTKAKDLAKIDVDTLRSLASKDKAAAQEIAFNMKLTTIKTLNRDPDTRELASALKHIVDDVYTDQNRPSNPIFEKEAEKMDKDLEIGGI